MSAVGEKVAAKWRRKWLGTFVFCGTLFVTGTGLAQGSLPRTVPPPNPARQIPKHPLPAHVPNGFTVAAVGDLIMAHPASASRNPGFLGVEKLLRGADVTFGNLEETLIDPRAPGLWPAAENGGSDLNGPPSLAADIKKMGFNMLSRANNHSTDWGAKGMEDTSQALDRVRLVHAGTGRNLALARAARYLTIPQGLIGLVAMTSTYTRMEAAGMPLRGVAGRPGANVLHNTLYHVVTAQQMSGLRNIFNSQPRKPSHPAASNVKKLYLFGTHYCVGTTYCAGMDPNRDRTGTAPRLTYRMNPYDLNGILRAIREGKEASNFEIVSIHAHNPGNWSEWPADFMPTLAHDAINAGADEFVAAGPHRLRGIEIYKGKPIFYSLGNFFFEDGQIQALDPAFLEQSKIFGLEPETTTFYEYQQLHLREGHFDEPIWYQSAVAVSTFDSKGDVREIKLYPVDLGYKRVPRTDIGIPRLAPPQMAQKVLHRLQRLSRPYGTHITIQGNVGVIRVTAGE